MTVILDSGLLPEPLLVPVTEETFASAINAAFEKARDPYESDEGEYYQGVNRCSYNAKLGVMIPGRVRDKDNPIYRDDVRDPMFGGVARTIAFDLDHQRSPWLDDGNGNITLGLGWEMHARKLYCACHSAMTEACPLPLEREILLAEQDEMRRRQRRKC